MEALLTQGKIPVEEELKLHPERSLAARRCEYWMNFISTLTYMVYH
jgi:hypothetical protein